MNRLTAGEALAEALRGTIAPDEDAVVLGVARGGVPVAARVAAAFDLDLDVAVARKIGAPQNPEYAIGAVSSDGSVLLDESAVAALGLAWNLSQRTRRGV